MKSDIRGIYPSTLATTLVVVLLSLVWGTLRLLIFHETVFPLTFVLPLLVCIWTRRRWQLWTMAAAFSVMLVVKAWWILPEDKLTGWEDDIFLGASLFNLAVGAVTLHLIMSLRDGLEAQNARISAQNSELEAQAEELAQQNEEIKAQAEELAQQNEETESQAEELERQNEELQETSARLANREAMLQAVLQSARTAGGGQQVLNDVCRRALDVIGAPAEALAVLELEGESLQLRASARIETQPPLRQHWPLLYSLARVVLQEDQTAYVDDLRQRQDLAAPFAPEGTVRSLLATPLRVSGVKVGVVVVCARGVEHWTSEQFRLVEWIAAQCGLIVEGLRWQDALKDRAREVEAANSAKDKFLAMLSHELRTPLTPVLFAASAFEQDQRLPADVREELGTIRRNVAIQSRLIDDLLELTRIEQGKVQLHRQAVDVALLIRDAADIVAADLDAKDLTLALDVDLPPDTVIDGDGARLQQVFWNLLKNAIKFSPAKGHATLSARAIEPAGTRLLHVEIADAGIGIAPEDMERIFRPFEQGTFSTQQGSPHGLGLGLSIAKAIVELHGGTIRAASPGVGQGATFTVELPLAVLPGENTAAEPVPLHDVPDASGRSLDRSPPKILLVEDHYDTARLLSRLLRADGYLVEHAADVAAALDLFTRDTFDLLLSDLGLPDGNGHDLMRQIRAKHPELPGICLSGCGMESDIRMSHEVGFAEHVTKPVEVRQLQDAIARVIKGARSSPACTQRLAAKGSGNGHESAATPNDN